MVPRHDRQGWRRGRASVVTAETTWAGTVPARRLNPKALPGVGIAFFFFTFNDVSKQDMSAMLRTLVCSCHAS